MSPVATPERDVHAREYARPALPRFVDVLRSEWTKLRSLRSTWFTLAATLAVTVGVGALVAGGVAEEFRDMSADDRASFIPTADAYFVGCLIGSIAIAVLGVLSFSGEHGTRMIRTSLAAVPRRTTLLAAKSAVLASVSMAAGLVIAFALFGTTQLVLSYEGVPTSALGDPHVLQATIGVALYFTVFALLAVAAGTLIRATAGAIVAVFAFSLLVPNIVISALPEALQDFLYDYWPTVAGLYVAVAVGENPDGLDPWQGFAVMTGFTAVVLAGAFLVFSRRDV